MASPWGASQESGDRGGWRQAVAKHPHWCPALGTGRGGPGSAVTCGRLRLQPGKDPGPWAAPPPPLCPPSSMCAGWVEAFPAQPLAQRQKAALLCPCQLLQINVGPVAGTCPLWRADYSAPDGNRTMGWILEEGSSGAQHSGRTGCVITGWEREASAGRFHARKWCRLGKGPIRFLLH